MLEGVERAGELRALRDVGARLIQGVHLARPMFAGLHRHADVNWDA